MTAGGAPARTGMALAAGLGTRMRPLTNDRPKCLIEVAGRTLLDHALDTLAACGVTRAIVNVHYFPNQVEAHLRTRTFLPAIVISDERALLLETGGGVVKALPLLGGEPVIVTNTDAIFVPGDADALRPLLADFDPAREDSRLILVPKARAMGMNGNGDFHLTPDHLLVPPEKGGEAPYFYTGMQILNPDILKGWPEKPFSMYEVWRTAIAAGRLTGRVFAGDWLHVGDPAGLAAAERRLAR